MEKLNFEEAVKIITARDATYRPDGYQFLKDALKHSVDKLRKDELVEHRHVTGPELLHGVVEFALQEYGSMAVSVLDSWGIRAGEDIGAMVFLLIDVGAFGRSEEDSPADFMNVVDLKEELVAPFRPSGKVVLPTEQGGDSEPPARGNQPANRSEL